MSVLEPRVIAAYATEIARAFGLDVAVAEPRNERQVTLLVASLRTRLAQVRPVASAGSIGEVLDILAACARTDAGGGGATRRVRRHLAELDDLVAAATYARTKRAERGRVFALLLVVFGLVQLTGANPDSEDPETTLKLVRRARR